MDFKQYYLTYGYILYYMYVTVSDKGVHTCFAARLRGTSHTRTLVKSVQVRLCSNAHIYIYIIGSMLRTLIRRISRASSSSLEVCAAARLQIDRRDNKRIKVYSFILALCQCDFSVYTVRICVDYELRAYCFFLLFFYLPPKTP